MLSRWGLRESYSLRAHLIAFAAVTLLPVTVLAAVLLARSAALEREQLEAWLVQVADIDFAADGGIPACRASRGFSPWQSRLARYLLYHPLDQGRYIV